ncbi:MAG TPA: ATP-binding protein [Dissulfurispiraceae bacterium]|nr:ATP-binding protein [Dissulfurispiraceae bacterium]
MQQFMSAFDNFPALIRKWGENAKCDYFNKTWLDFTGRQLADELGDGWMDDIHPDDFERFIEQFNKAFNAKRNFEIEYRLKNFDQEYRWIVEMGRPFDDSSGVFTGYLGSAYDIHEKRQAEEILKVSQDYFKSFIESSQDCVAHISHDGSFLSINEAGCKLHGFKEPSDAVSQNFCETVITNREQADSAIKNAASGNSDSIRYMSRDYHGNEHWWDAKFTPVLDFGEQIRSILLVSRDITEQKRAEHALEQKNVELENAYVELKAAQSQILQQEKMASIGQLAAGVAHEINNPMGFIMSNLNTLNKYMDKIYSFMDSQHSALESCTSDQVRADVLTQLNEKKRHLKIDYVTDDIRNLIAESLDGADRVKKIVQDLKGFSRLDEAEYKMADINAGLESTINIVWNELKYKATVTKDFGELQQIKCRPGQLNQVFMNLLLNAAQAISDHGEIRIKTHQDNKIIIIAISDNGCGIPENIRKRIFEPFFTTKEVGKGTGLGLSIAYDIIKKHDGEIRVDSIAGKGTTFTISIPVMEG